jgi:hypothetical protein
MLDEYKKNLARIESLQNDLDAEELDNEEILIEIIKFYEKFIDDIATNKLKTKKDILTHAKLIYKEMLIEFRE